MGWQAAADASCPAQLPAKAAGQDGGDSETCRNTEENIKQKKKKPAKGKRLRGRALKEINYDYCVNTLVVVVGVVVVGGGGVHRSEAGSKSQRHFRYLNH